MLFGKLLPREGHLVAAAQAFEQLVVNYGDENQRESAAKSVDDAEHAADRVTHEVNKLLHQTFITPLDREHIHSLINTMDDVADLIQDAAETLALYDVRAMTDDIKSLSTLNLKCCERVRSVVAMIGKISDAKTAEAALKACEDIDKIESDADRVMRKAMSRLFREEQDVRELIKLKAIYELLESVSDSCEDVANVIEGIVLENA